MGVIQFTFSINDVQLPFHSVELKNEDLVKWSKQQKFKKKISKIKTRKKN